MNILGRKYSDFKVEQNQPTNYYKMISIELIKDLLKNTNFDLERRKLPDIINYLEIEYFSKNDIVDNSIYKANYIYMILSGVLEVSVKYNDKNHCVVLLNEGNILPYAAIQGLTQHPLTIQCVKKSILLKINTDNILLANELHYKAMAKHIDNYVIKQYNHFLISTNIIQRLSAEALVDELYDKYYDLFYNIPQNKIACCFGIKSETLSRMVTRKKDKWEEGLDEMI